MRSIAVVAWADPRVEVLAAQVAVDASRLLRAEVVLAVQLLARRGVDHRVPGKEWGNDDFSYTQKYNTNIYSQMESLDSNCQPPDTPCVNHTNTHTLIGMTKKLHAAVWITHMSFPFVSSVIFLFLL